jgi:hypothetical protein
MQKPLEPDKLVKIQYLYRRKPEAKRFFDWGANQISDSAETAVENAVQQLGLEYAEVLELFKKIAKIGIGSVIFGRRGRPTRLVWDYRLQDISQRAKEAGISSNADRYAAEDDKPILEAADSVKMVEHFYKLRPDMTINFYLPTDLTKKEAERIGTFVLSLPFE